MVFRLEGLGLGVGVASILASGIEVEAVSLVEAVFFLLSGTHAGSVLLPRVREQGRVGLLLVGLGVGDPVRRKVVVDGGAVRVDG